MTDDDDSRLFASREEAEAWAYRHSAEIWKQAFHASQRAGLYVAVPGLLCGIGVFTSADADWWVNAVAGATIATSLAVFLGAVAAWRENQRVRAVNRDLLRRFHDDEGGDDG